MDCVALIGIRKQNLLAVRLEFAVPYRDCHLLRINRSFDTHLLENLILRTNCDADDGGDCVFQSTILLKLKLVYGRSCAGKVQNHVGGILPMLIMAALSNENDGKKAASTHSYNHIVSRGKAYKCNHNCIAMVSPFKRFLNGSNYGKQIVGKDACGFDSGEYDSGGGRVRDWDLSVWDPTKIIGLHLHSLAARRTRYWYFYLVDRWTHPLTGQTGYFRFHPSKTLTCMT